MKSTFNDLMKNAISLLVIGTFLSVGYAVFRYGKDLTAVQADIIKDWIWWGGFAFSAVIFTWFPSAMPFLKDVVGSLVSLRTGRQDAPISPVQTVQTAPLPPSPVEYTPTTQPMHQYPNISQINSLPTLPQDATLKNMH